MGNGKHMRQWGRWAQGAGLVCAWATVAGCRSNSPAGQSLPTTSPSSVALPGAVNSADAPNAPAVTESSTADLVGYRDRIHGVSFQYPAAWRPEGVSGSLPPPEFAAVAPAPLITQAFHAEGTFYANTVLRSLDFSYTVQSKTNAAACAALPGKALQGGGRRTTATYNGVPFTEVSGGDAGMCHQRKAVIDSALRGTDCFLFERDTATTCPYLKTDKEPRPLSTGEQADLARHLDAVMASVRMNGLQK